MEVDGREVSLTSSGRGSPPKLYWIRVLFMHSVLKHERKLDKKRLTEQIGGLVY